MYTVKQSKPLRRGIHYLDIQYEDISLVAPTHQNLQGPCDQTNVLVLYPFPHISSQKSCQKTEAVVSSRAASIVYPHPYQR